MPPSGGGSGKGREGRRWVTRRGARGSLTVASTAGTTLTIEPDHVYEGAPVTTKRRIVALTGVAVLATVGSVVGTQMADAAAAVPAGTLKVSSVVMTFTAGSNVANTVSVSGTRDGFVVIQ